MGSVNSIFVSTWVLYRAYVTYGMVVKVPCHLERYGYTGLRYSVLRRFCFIRDERVMVMDILAIHFHITLNKSKMEYIPFKTKNCFQ